MPVIKKPTEVAPDLCNVRTEGELSCHRLRSLNGYTGPSIVSFFSFLLSPIVLGLENGREHNVRFFSGWVRFRRMLLEALDQLQCQILDKAIAASPSWPGLKEEERLGRGVHASNTHHNRCSIRSTHIHCWHGVLRIKVYKSTGSSGSSSSPSQGGLAARCEEPTYGAHLP